jgi:hypothetical protein
MKNPTQEEPMTRRFTTIDSITELKLEGVLFSTGTAVVAHPIEGIGMTLASEKELIHQFDVAWVDAADGDEADPERERLRRNLGSLLKLLNDIVDEDGCSFDDNGGCQAHGYPDLGGGVQCPHQEAKEVLAAFAADPAVDLVAGGLGGAPQISAAVKAR